MKKLVGKICSGNGDFVQWITRQGDHYKSASLLLLFSLVLVSGSMIVCGAETNQTFSVHGRLCYYNGTPSCRIWIVGTKRVLGVFESSESGYEVPAMPKGLQNLMSWEQEVFADFVVEPVTAYKKGVMQIVRVVSASKIVVTENGKIVLRKDKL